MNYQHLELLHRHKLNPILTGADWPYPINSVFNAGARQLSEIVSNWGYTSSCVDIRNVPNILHLKSGLACLGDNRLVLIDSLANRSEFNGYSIVHVAPEENYAANCVRVNDFVLIAQGYPKLQIALNDLGYRTIALDMSEYQKMDGGLSCLSLRF